MSALNVRLVNFLESSCDWGGDAFRARNEKWKMENGQGSENLVWGKRVLRDKWEMI